MLLPFWAPQAQRQLVISYKRLRGDDATPGSASAYRITVRPPAPARTPHLLLPHGWAWLACTPSWTLRAGLEGLRGNWARCCSSASSPRFPPASPRPVRALPALQVRQLEALVRLSEALARLHLCEEVKRDHVKEVSNPGRQEGTQHRCIPAAPLPTCSSAQA